PGGFRPAPLPGAASSSFARSSSNPNWTPELLNQAQQAQQVTPQYQQNQWALMMAQSMFAPQLAALNAQSGSLYSSIANHNALNSLNQQGLHIKHKHARAHLQRPAQQTGFQQQAIGSEIAYLQALMGVQGDKFNFNQQQLNNQMKQLRDRFDTDREFNL